MNEGSGEEEKDTENERTFFIIRTVYCVVGMRRRKGSVAATGNENLSLGSQLSSITGCPSEDFFFSVT